MSSSSYAVVKEWRKKNPDKVAAQARRYREKHPDKRKAITDRYREANHERIRERDREAQKRWRQENPGAQIGRYEAYKLRREAEKIALAGRPRPTHCELCGEEARVVFDHCHQRGHFRGWICDRCNRTLGQVRDDTHLLRKMIAYLEKNNGGAQQQAEEVAP